MIDIGLYSRNFYGLRDQLNGIKEHSDTELNPKYISFGYDKLTLNAVYNIDVGVDYVDTLYKQIIELMNYPKEDLELVLRLDNPYIYKFQLQEDVFLNEILNVFNHFEYYIVYTNDLVRDYIKENFPRIKLIISEFRYNLETLDSFMLSYNGEDIEINSSIYENFLPFIEYGKIKVEKVWVTIDKCVFCDIRKTCVKNKGLNHNHITPIIDIFPCVWKYNIGYSACYTNQKNLSLDDIKYRLQAINKRGITKFFIGDYDFFSVKSKKFFELFMSEENLHKWLQEIENAGRSKQPYNRM